MNLCSSPVLKEPMGSDKRVFDIFGLTPKDIMQMDLDTFIDFEKRVTNMRVENEKELIARVKHLEKTEREKGV